MLVKLKDVCTFESNNFNKKDNWTFVNYLDTSNLTENVIQDFQYLEDLDNLPSRAKRKVKIGDILFSSVRPNQKHYGFIDKEYPNLLVSTGFIVLTPTEKVNNKFLYYWLIQDKTIDILQTKAETSTSAYPSITKEDMYDLEIDLPPLEIQDKIANILSNIDNQIGRNNAMTKRLQVLAQTTYSRWFNQFEFPNNEGKPYKSDGGELVYNKELGKEIPIDWEVKTLGDLIKKVTPNFDYSSNLPTIDLSVMPSSSFMLNELNESKNFTSNLFAMEKGNILFGSIRPYLKKAGIAPCNGVVAGTVHQYKEIDKDFYNFALMTMVQDSFFDYALQVATGTKMPVVSSDNLLNYKVPFNKEIVKKFQDSFNLVGITCNCVMQNQELNRLKEKLLPLLINGQLNI